MSKQKFYAIKKGKGVENKIVSTWEECKSLVEGYHSEFKSFKTGGGRDTCYFRPLAK